MRINIDDLIGIPYKEHGRDASGYDCYGLAIEVCRRYGFVLNDVYYTDDHDISLSEKNRPTLNCFEMTEPKEGAVIEIHTREGLHIGVCINNKEFIHATKSGVRISPIGAFNVCGIWGLKKDGDNLPL